MNALKIMALKGIYVIYFLLIFFINPVFAVEHPPPENKSSSVLSYGITFFAITPDFKSDILIHLSILNNENKLDTDKARLVTLILFKYIHHEGYAPVIGIAENPYSNKIDIDIVQTSKGIIVQINKHREDKMVDEKLFDNETAEDIAFDISCQLFGRGI